MRTDFNNGRSPDDSERARGSHELSVYSDRNILIEMRDGVKLAADVHRPSRDGQVLEGSLPRCCSNELRITRSAEAVVLEAVFSLPGAM